MRILLTGGSGFLGRHLLILLEKSKATIHHLVREKRGLQHEHLWDFSGPLPGGIPPCDIVVHLAASVNFGSQMSVEQYKVNTVSAMRLGGYCNKHQAHFILASMTGVHGQHELIDLRSPIIPENHYGMSKYLAEEVVRCFTGNHTILRICGIYGLNGPSHLGLNKAISQAFHQEVAPVLKGSGRARRNYICVNDAANWLFDLIVGVSNKKPSIDAATQDEIIYMSGNEVLTIAEYLQTVVEVLIPGKKIIREEGPDGVDSIVASSVSPVPLRSFRDYLTEIHQGKLQQVRYTK